MAITVQEQITREVARLRMWRDVANDDELKIEVEKTHMRINDLLDQLYAPTQSKAAPCPQSTTQPRNQHHVPST